jgi:hypothetical protein
VNLKLQPALRTRYASASRLLRPLHEQRPRRSSAPHRLLAASQYQGRRRTQQPRPWRKLNPDAELVIDNKSEG